MPIYGIIFPHRRAAAGAFHGNWKTFGQFLPSSFRRITASAHRKNCVALGVIRQLFPSRSLIFFKYSFGRSFHSRAPCRSLCSPPALPAGRFGLRPRPRWGHASLRDRSLRSPAGKRDSAAHFGGGVRYVAHSMVGSLSPALLCARSSTFSLRCLSPPSPPQLARGILKPCGLGCFGVA